MKVLSTWDHGLPANDCALAAMRAGGTALDAVEAGSMLTELSNGQRSMGWWWRSCAPSIWPPTAHAPCAI
jgi:hypothetical protein